MSKAIYIATTSPDSGKSIVSLGLMKLLLGRAAKVGYFRPIIDDYGIGIRDNHINTMISYFDLNMEYEEAYACTRSEVIQKVNNHKDDEVLDQIIAGYKAIESRFDFLLVEGTDFSGEGSIIEWDINVLMAKNLGIPTILISSGVGKPMEEFVNEQYLAYDSFKDHGVEVLLVIAKVLLLCLVNSSQSAVILFLN